MDRIDFYNQQIDIITSINDKFSSINATIQKVLIKISQDSIVNFYTSPSENNDSNTTPSIPDLETKYYELPTVETKSGDSFKVFLPVKVINDDIHRPCFRLKFGFEQTESIRVQILNLLILGIYQKLMNSTMDYDVYPFRRTSFDFKIGTMKVNVKLEQAQPNPKILYISSINFEL